MPPEPALTVVIPTRDRRQILLQTLERLGEGFPGGQFELIVVDDGSTDGTGSAVTGWARSSGVPTVVLGGSATGPAAARNLALERARSICMFLDDDVRPAPGMVERHLDFHRIHPEAPAALLGRVVPAAEHDSELARWAHEQGALFEYGALSPAELVPATRFWSAQVSVKTALVQAVGGFDPGLRYFEDVELAHRLTAAGMQLRYDPDSVGEHLQEVTLERLMERARESGPYFRALRERLPETPLPRPPGWRHRFRAAALTTLNAIGAKPRTVRHATWRFLVDEAQREALHGSTETKLRVGSGLERSTLESGT